MTLRLLLASVSTGCAIGAVIPFVMALRLDRMAKAFNRNARRADGFIAKYGRNRVYVRVPGLIDPLLPCYLPNGYRKDFPLNSVATIEYTLQRTSKSVTRIRARLAKAPTDGMSVAKRLAMTMGYALIVTAAVLQLACLLL